MIVARVVVGLVLAALVIAGCERIVVLEPIPPDGAGSGSGTDGGSGFGFDGGLTPD